MEKSNVTSISSRFGKGSSNTSSRAFRDQIVGKTIAGVVAKPGKAGQPPMVLMLQFDDGSVVEWVSPRSDMVLRRALSDRSVRSMAGTMMGQACLELPMMDGPEYHSV